MTVFIPIICVLRVLLHEQTTPLACVPQFIPQDSPLNLNPIREGRELLAGTAVLQDEHEGVLTAADLAMAVVIAPEGAVAPL